jgi:Flp pilus assembly protein TadG
MILKRRKQAGAAMIEMVAVTPLLLMLLLGISELGKGFMQYNALNKSVREAAREVARKALLGTTGTLSLSSDLIAEGKNLVVYGNVAGLGQPRLPDLAASHVSVTDAGNNLVLIQANYPYTPLVGPVLETFGYGSDPATNGITLTATVIMRAL